MTQRRFHILDVFAEVKYAGNQLAVVPDAAELSTKEMQRIAKEFNFSETTFILGQSEKGGAWDVRIFTPESELPFAGHPSLGTAFVVQQNLIQKEVTSVTLRLKAGLFPVAFSYVDGKPDELVMTQLAPTFGPDLDKKKTAESLGLAQDAIDERFPVMEVSTGVPIIIAPVRDLTIQKQIKVYLPKFFRFVKNIESKAILTFCSETYDTANRLNARVFADYYGVPEDPATGSANGCLAAYLVKHRYLGQPAIDLYVEQGIEIGRPSRLHLMAEDKDGGISVQVGGRVIPVATGELL